MEEVGPNIRGVLYTGPETTIRVVGMKSFTRPLDLKAQTNTLFASLPIPDTGDERDGSILLVLARVGRIPRGVHLVHVGPHRRTQFVLGMGSCTDAKGGDHHKSVPPVDFACHSHLLPHCHPVKLR